MGAVSPFALAWDGPGKACVTLGEPKTVLDSGQLGLTYFPDGPLAVVQAEPECRVILSAGISSFLLQGPTIEKIASARRVLAPGAPGEFDNGYAGIRGVWRAPSGELAAFYHAEDQEGMPRLPGDIPGFYCRIAMAVSNDDGLKFTKIGPILSGQLPKDKGGRGDQGIGECCVAAEPGGRFLYVYYTSHEHLEGRAAEIGMARCGVDDWRKPDAWRKFHHGDFSEPGLGGRATPVVAGGRPHDAALFPHVVYVPQWQKFLMTYCLYANDEPDRPERSGIYLAFSADGIHWPVDARQQLWKARTLPAIGKDLSWEQTLWLESASPSRLRGWLYYGHTESWGHKPPQKPHYLVRRAIEISRDAKLCFARVL